MFKNKKIKCHDLVVGEHIIKSISKLIGTLLDLQLLPVDLIFNVVNPLVQLGDVHLSILKPGLSGLVLALQVVYLFNKLLLPLQGLFSRLFKLLHVVSNCLKLFLNALQILLSKLSPLNSPLELSFLDSELPAQLIQLLLIVRGHLDSGPQVLVQLLDGDLVVQADILNNLDGLHDIVSSLGGQSELLIRLLQGLIGLG